MLDVPTLMTALARRRPLFHSEADFQHALAWLIHESHPHAQVRLELPRRIAGRRAHVDVWVVDKQGAVAIELKYLTRALTARVDGETFELLDQAAQDLGRYDVIKDVWRIETLVVEGAARRGVVIALTNDSGYWAEPRALAAPNYDAFRLHEGRRISGVLA